MPARQRQKKKLYFKARCTKTRDGRFNLGEVYNMYMLKKQGEDYYSIIADTHVDCANVVIHCDTSNPKDDFKLWHKECRWRDYDFEYIDANEYIVELL